MLVARRAESPTRKKKLLSLTKRRNLNRPTINLSFWQGQISPLVGILEESGEIRAIDNQVVQLPVLWLLVLTQSTPPTMPMMIEIGSQKT